MNTLIKKNEPSVVIETFSGLKSVNGSVLHDISRITQPVNEFVVYTESDLLYSESSVDKIIGLYGMILEEVINNPEEYKSYVNEVDFSYVKEKEIKSRADVEEILYSISKKKDAPRTLVNIVRAFVLVFGILVNYKVIGTGVTQTVLAASEAPTMFRKILAYLRGAYAGFSLFTLSGIISLVSIDMIIWLLLKVINMISKNEYCTPNEKAAAYSDLLINIESSIHLAYKTDNKEKVKELESMLLRVKTKQQEFINKAY